MPDDSTSGLADTLSSPEPGAATLAPRAKDSFASARTLSASAGHVDAEALVRGTTVGRYVILDRIGEGGMGVVYSAYDPELDRKLALKLLRYGDLGGSGSSEGRARLLREAQAMARLSHPNVVAVHDVGTYGTRVFVAMELTEGGTLRTWLATPRTWREIVAIFVQAGRGLAAAHAVGIVHRDFKPENVLIAKDGRARVADFGIAHAGDGLAPVTKDAALVAARDRSSGSLETPITEQGRLLGTPLYMAPEQLEGNRTDASGDQFSFCVSLYEALYGEVPFEGNDLITLSSNVRSGKIRRPRTDRQIPGWLRQTLSRGLSTKPEARYPSMNALLASLERDPSRIRNRWLGAGATAVVVVVAVLGAIGVRNRRPPLCPSSEPLLAGVWDDARKDAMGEAFRRTRKPYAEDALRGVDRALDSYARSWVAMHDEACVATRVRGEQSGELMDLRMECLDGRLAGLRALTSQFMSADEKIVERSLQASDALEPLSACADKAALRSPTRLPQDPAARKQIEAVRSQLAEAHAVGYASKPADGLALAKTAALAATELHFKPLEAEALTTEGDLLLLNGSYKDAAAVLEDAVVAAESGHHESIETTAWTELTRADAGDARSAEGRSAARHAHACLEREGGDEDRLATLLLYEGQVAFGEDHIDEAIELHKRSLAILERRLPPDHPSLAENLDRLSLDIVTKGDVDTAVAYSRRSLSIREKALGPAHPAIATSLNNLGNALQAGEKFEEAVSAYRRSLAIRLAAFGEDSLLTANVLSNLGLALSQKGNLTEALQVEDRALAIRLRLLGPDHTDLHYSYGNLADVQLRLDRYDDAIASASRSLSLLEKAWGPESPLLAPSATQLGEAYLGKGYTKRAVATLERALKLAEGRDTEPGKLAGTKEALALAIVADHGDRARARRLAREARAIYVSEGEGAKTDVANIDREFP